jgi:hypothetical protein
MRHLMGVLVGLLATACGNDSPMTPAPAPAPSPPPPPPPPAPALVCGTAQVCAQSWSSTKVEDPAYRPPGVVDWWEITIRLWNDGPTCAGSVEGRAYVTYPSSYHTFRSGRDGPEPLPVGASSVRVGTTQVEMTMITSVQLVSWTRVACTGG